MFYVSTSNRLSLTFKFGGVWREEPLGIGNDASLWVAPDSRTLSVTYLPKEGNDKELRYWYDFYVFYERADGHGVAALYGRRYGGSIGASDSTIQQTDPEFYDISSSDEAAGWRWVDLSTSLALPEGQEKVHAPFASSWHVEHGQFTVGNFSATYTTSVLFAASCNKSTDTIAFYEGREGKLSLVRLSLNDSTTPIHLILIIKRFRHDRPQAPTNTV